MVKFNLIAIIDGFYRYEVFPEGKLEKREIFEFNPLTRELKRNAPPEYGFDYVSKCLANLKTEDGSLKEYGMIAWY